MRIALDSLPTNSTTLQQLVRKIAAALDEELVEINRLRLLGSSAERLDLH